MDILTFMQQMVNGFSLGSMYALIAIGYTMVYGVLRLINFAHGDIMMVGAFLAYTFMAVFDLPFPLTVLLAVTISASFGMFMDKIAYKPLREAPKISLLITAIGISFFLENAFTVFLGGVPRAFPVPEYMENIFNVAGVTFSFASIMVPIVTLFLLMGILYVLYTTAMAIVAPQAILSSLYAVTRIPINRLTSIIAVVVYIASITITMIYFGKKKNSKEA